MRHTWGDSWPHWSDLHNAIYRIILILTRWGRISCHGKEKYGTFRDHVQLWDGTLHALIYPGYVWIKWGRLYWDIDYKWIRPIMYYTGIWYIFTKYQTAVYNYAIQSTVRKYPHIEKELTSSIDGYEMITPGIFGPLDGVIINLTYWVGGEKLDYGMQSYEQWIEGE